MPAVDVRTFVTMNLLKEKLSILVMVLSATVLSCEDDEESPGDLSIGFEHVIGNTPINFNSMEYTNAAGNLYEITDIQWFVSDLELIREDGSSITAEGNSFYHYIDTNLPETFDWILNDIPPGDYKAIRFVFGLKGERNTPGLFPDLPESNMLWPYALGGDNGGYHYMKLNGFWKNPSDVRTPFNFHIGVGQLYDNEGNVTSFVQNWFETTIPVDFVIRQKSTTRVSIVMNADSWFTTPVVYDHNVYGGMIMKNQTAMNMIRENGFDVFSAKVSTQP
jgi:hypothetical protein